MPRLPACPPRPKMHLGDEVPEAATGRGCSLVARLDRVDRVVVREAVPGSPPRVLGPLDESRSPTPPAADVQGGDRPHDVHHAMLTETAGEEVPDDPSGLNTASPIAVQLSLVNQIWGARHHHRNRMSLGVSAGHQPFPARHHRTGGRHSPHRGVRYAEVGGSKPTKAQASDPRRCRSPACDQRRRQRQVARAGGAELTTSGLGEHTRRASIPIRWSSLMRREAGR